MRTVTKSWISTAFLFALAASFGVWGIADIFRGATDTSVATVGGVEIDAQSFSRDLSNLRRNAAERAGGQLPQAQALALGHDALEHAISDTALDNTARGFGLSATDAEVSSAIRLVPAFRGPLGSFDEMTFRQVLERLNFTETAFVAEIRRDLARDQLVHAGTNAALLPEGYVAALFDYLNEHRAVQYFILPSEAAGPVPPPSDAQLTAYVKSHPDGFSTPEYRELTYAAIFPQDVENQVQVTETQLRQTYDLRKDVYIIPEKRDVQRINFPDEASAKAARAKIDAGENFEAVAASRGIAPADLDLGALSQADLGPAQGPVAFALPVGGISEPVKYTFGWSLLRVTKITPGSAKTFDDMKSVLRAELVKQLAASKAEDIVNAFNDARDGGADLVQAAKKAGMRVIHVAATDARGLAPNGDKADVPDNPTFLAEIFKSDVGEEGDPFATPDGSQYVLKVEGVIPEKLKPLDAVRAQATADWIATERRSKLAEKAADIARQANGTLGPAATAARATLQESEALSRDVATPVFTQSLISAIFASPPGKAVFGATANGQSYIVASVTGVLHPPLPLGDPRYQRLIRLLGEQLGEDLETSMGAAERARQGVTINRQQVDRILGAEGS